MLNIYTLNNNMSKFKLIPDVELGFLDVKLSGELFSDNVYNYIMKSIDGISNRKGDYIETVFGSTSMDKLSTGCKAVLLAYYYRNNKDILVNIVECGDNAIEILFKLSKKYDIYVYTHIFYRKLHITINR